MIEFKDRELKLNDEINFSNAETIYAKGLKLIQTQQTFPITVNLAGLKYSNTLALAVLIRWLRQTPQSEGLVFKAVPEKMMKIIQSCHLTADLKFV